MQRAANRRMQDRHRTKAHVHMRKREGRAHCAAGPSAKRCCPLRIRAAVLDLLVGRAPGSDEIEPGPGSGGGEDLPSGNSRAAVLVWRAPGSDENPLDGEAEDLPKPGPMFRGVYRSWAGEEEGCHGGAGGFKHSLIFPFNSLFKPRIAVVPSLLFIGLARRSRHRNPVTVFIEFGLVGSQAESFIHRIQSSSKFVCHISLLSQPGPPTQSSIKIIPVGGPGRRVYSSSPLFLCGSRDDRDLRAKSPAHCSPAAPGLASCAGHGGQAGPGPSPSSPRSRPSPAPAVTVNSCSD